MPGLPALKRRDQLSGAACESDRLLARVKALGWLMVGPTPLPSVTAAAVVIAQLAEQFIPFMSPTINL